MKVTVKATAPELEFTGDSLGLLSVSDDRAVITIKQGSYDRLFYSAYSVLPDGDTTSGLTEKITLVGNGGVKVTDGILYATKATKPNRPAKVTLKCGKSKTILYVTVK